MVSKLLLRCAAKNVVAIKAVRHTGIASTGGAAMWVRSHVAVVA